MAENYAALVGKKATLIYKEDGKTDATEVEGTVDTVNDDALLFKPKGKTQLLLIAADNVIEVRALEESVKKVTRKTLKLVKPGQARNHLAERHGLKLADVNSLTEEQAFEYHENLDHEKLDLGHVHKEKKDPSKDDSSEE
jgi:hypothetical protein